MNSGSELGPCSPPLSPCGLSSENGSLFADLFDIGDFGDLGGVQGQAALFLTILR